jgi:hypothetical protein
MPNNSITNIKDYFGAHGGLQRNNRYQVYFENLPSGIGYPGDIKNIQAMNVTIGARAVDAVADNLSGYGPGRAVPRTQKFIGGVYLAFPVTNDNHILKMFNNWFNLLYSGPKSGGSFTVNYYDDYVKKANMVVQILDPNGGINSTVRFYEVYPLETQPLEFTMVRNNEYSIYQVLMNYREFKFN